MLKSAAWPAVDVRTLDDCYMIRATAADGSAEEYYAFIQNGRACLQWKKAGRYSLIDDKYYTAIKQLMDAWSTQRPRRRLRKTCRSSYPRRHGRLIPAIM